MHSAPLSRGKNSACEWLSGAECRFDESLQRMHSAPLSPGNPTPARSPGGAEWQFDESSEDA